MRLDHGLPGQLSVSGVAFNFSKTVRVKEVKATSIFIYLFDSWKVGSVGKVEKEVGRPPDAKGLILVFGCSVTMVTYHSNSNGNSLFWIGLIS